MRYYAPEKVNLDHFFTCHVCKPGCHFLSSCSEVNSIGYSEFDEPISAHLQPYPLFEYILIQDNCYWSLTVTTGKKSLDSSKKLFANGVTVLLSSLTTDHLTGCSSGDPHNLLTSTYSVPVLCIIRAFSEEKLFPIISDKTASLQPHKQKFRRD